jgi:hypothetical protein
VRSAQLEQNLAELAGRIRDLEARLGQNGFHSSMPPSADPASLPRHR